MPPPSPPQNNNPPISLPPIRTSTQENTAANTQHHFETMGAKPADTWSLPPNAAGATSAHFSAQKFDNPIAESYPTYTNNQNINRNTSQYTTNQPPEALPLRSPRSPYTSAPQSPSHYSQPPLSPKLTPNAPLTSDSSIPSPTTRRQFLRDLPYEAVGHERPGVLSRFPHRLGDLRAVRQELQEELESELAAELAAHGIIDPNNCKGLTPAEYLACMDALRERRAIAASQMTDDDRRREQYMRSTVTWHVDGVTKSVAAATKTSTASQSVRRNVSGATGREGRGGFPSHTPNGAGSLSPILLHSASPVESTLADLGDVDTTAFYSPLRHGTSEGGNSTPTTPKRIPQLL